MLRTAVAPGPMDRRVTWLLAPKTQFGQERTVATDRFQVARLIKFGHRNVCPHANRYRGRATADSSRSVR